jgi:hypothetical protein
MSKTRKLNKIMERKLATRAAIEKRKAKKTSAGYLSLSLNDDYYASVDHYSYEDLNDLMGYPEAYSGKYD